MMKRCSLLATSVVFVLCLALCGVGWAQSPEGREQTTPSYQDERAYAAEGPVGPIDPGGEIPAGPTSPGVTPPIATIEACNFDDNAVENGGYLFIPPDPIAAAGPNHLVNVVNTMIEWYERSTGVREHRDALQDFFGPTPLGTPTFDPKVIYDQYAGRFVVVTLERTTGPNDSYILVAVSKTSNPNDGWWFHSIDSKTRIGGINTWADYPGLAVDDKAVYITSNMFSFFGPYAGVRLWIIDKGLGGGFYGGGPASVNVYDPYALAGVPGNEATTQPAHMFGPMPTGQSGFPVGTWLVSYSGWTNGGAVGSEWMHLIEVDDPLGTDGGPYFYQEWCHIGDIEDIGGAFGWPSLPDAPQLGSVRRIEVNDRRCLNAVWRYNKLYASTTILPNSGPDLGQTTAHWLEMDTSTPSTISMNDHGDVGAEDLGIETYTYFPSVMVNKVGDMAVGFSASNTSMYASACYTGREPADPAGTVKGTNVYAAGMDSYYRTFGGSDNRWGDYSGLALCPNNELTFWAYNEYAITRGTPTGREDGRWGTRYAGFRITSRGDIPATVEFMPSFLGPSGIPKSVPCYIELPVGYDPADIRVGTVMVNDALGAKPWPRRVGDFDGDGIPDRMVVFDRSDLIDLLTAPVSGTLEGEEGTAIPVIQPWGDYAVTVSGVLTDGTRFSGRDVIRVVGPVAGSVGSDGATVVLHPTSLAGGGKISYELAEAGPVSLRIYDAAGRLMRTLEVGHKSAGPHEVAWDRRTDDGLKAGPGVYFIRLEQRGEANIQKLLIVE
jgi:hypothetical protein